METATREMNFLLAEPEQRLLRTVASRLPRWVRANHMTALGVAGAVGTGAAYALSARDSGWLWAASLMLVVNWFGDSLDGTLARVRKTERPRYGYYIDHVVDAFNSAVVGIGLGLSPYVQLELALLVVVLYLTLSINVYLESAVFGVFRMAYARLGPTEVRVLLLGINVLLVLAPGALGTPLPWLHAAGNASVAVLAGGMFALLAVRFARNLQRLDRLEPQSHLTRA
ncbi:MAG: CDP-alcohol phosphatidyltransferase family protein [Gemmatimonadetes bacterium]|nr:CDP-alcohol phosphatidyltransferase family protein [Gemmatimonadota bacterium]